MTNISIYVKGKELKDIEAACKVLDRSMSKFFRIAAREKIERMEAEFRKEEVEENRK